MSHLNRVCRSRIGPLRVHTIQRLLVLNTSSQFIPSLLGASRNTPTSIFLPIKISLKLGYVSTSTLTRPSATAHEGAGRCELVSTNSTGRLTNDPIKLQKSVQVGPSK
jgi:hypothetical protein